MMMQDLPTVVQLLKGLQQIPYLASKNIYRVAEHFLKMENLKVEQFCELLRKVKESVTQCSVCFVWQERERSCSFCGNAKRDQSIICVVESWQDVLAIEQTKGFTGVYHILGGVIYPLDGIGPEDLTIDALYNRIVQTKVKEVVMALSQTPEGEATAAYIAHKMSGQHVMLSCLARGLPVGSSLGSMDRLTVFKALSERRPF